MFRRFLLVRLITRRYFSRGKNFGPMNRPVDHLSTLATQLKYKNSYTISNRFNLAIDELSSVVPAMEVINNKLEEGHGLSFHPECTCRGVKDAKHLELLAQILTSPNCNVKSLDFSSMSLNLALFKPNQHLERVSLQCVHGVDGQHLLEFLENSQINSLSCFMVKFSNISKFFSGLKLCTSLQRLYVSYCKYEERVSDHINEATNLAELRIIVNDFEDGNNLIRRNSTIHTLDISMNLDFTQEQKTDFVEGLQVNSTLKMLNIFSLGKLESFGRGFPGNCMLHTLTLQASSSECIAELLQFPNGITKLDVTLPGTSDLNVFCDFVQKTTTIKTLNSDSYFKGDGNPLFCALFENTSITEFKMKSVFKIGPVSASTIARIFLEKPEKLTKFHLDDCSFYDESYLIIFNSLPGNTTLTSICIGNIDNASHTESLGEFVRKSTSLKYFNIRGDFFKNISKSFYSALLENFSILNDFHRFNSKNICLKNEGKFYILLLIFLW